jgi:peptidoglycan/LPS O-acetylase OafA/YrhL
MPHADIHPAGPVFVLGLLVFVLAIAIARKSEFYRTLVDKEITANRFHAIDCLRGCLAIAVVFHHLVINYQYYQTGDWALTPSRLNTFLGRGSVAFFFMITAFLFWSRAINEEGRLDTFRFYVSRLRRMVPMYLLSAGLVVVTALALTHFRLHESLLELSRHIVAWIFFTIPGAPNINTFGQTSLINTVLWSLVYEWKFYLIFPLLAIFARGRAQWYLAAMTALCIWFYSESQLEWFFFGGCVAAVLTRVEFVRKVAAGWVGSIVVVACLVATVEWQPLVYSCIGAVLLFVPFVVFASGNSMFGFLTFRAMRLLGVLSYSIYLLHNFVLFLLSRLVNHYVSVGALPERLYWVMGAFVLLLTVAIAAMTYRFIEHPYLRASPRSRRSGIEPGRVVIG